MADYRYIHLYRDKWLRVKTDAHLSEDVPEIIIRRRVDQMVDCRSHKPEVAGSSPAPAMSRDVLTSE